MNNLQNNMIATQTTEIDLGGNYTANCTGISITLKNSLARNRVHEVILTLVDFLLVLSNKEKISLNTLTYKPLLFYGHPTYFGLTNEELTIFISGPN